VNFILDTCSMLAYLQDEPGGEVVEGLLFDTSSICFAHSVNLCEVYYQLIRRSDDTKAREGIEDLLVDGVIERPDMGRTFWEGVEEHKARGKISLADCFCIALAAKLGGEVVTSDHAEFDPLVALGICAVKFIR
jgi:PIN domain nuclease of toxin-antitoxin system